METRNKIDSTFQIHYRNRVITEEQIVTRAMEAWQRCGNSLEDVHSIDFSLQPEEDRVQYTINGNSGSVGNFPLSS